MSKPASRQNDAYVSCLLAGWQNKWYEISSLLCCPCIRIAWTKKKTYVQYVTRKNCFFYPLHTPRHTPHKGHPEVNPIIVKFFLQIFKFYKISKNPCTVRAAICWSLQRDRGGRGEGKVLKQKRWGIFLQGIREGLSRGRVILSEFSGGYAPCPCCTKWTEKKERSSVWWELLAGEQHVFRHSQRTG